MPYARDVMTTGLKVLDAEADILAAIDFFHENRISTAPVQKRGGEVLGQLTELDLLRSLVRRKPEQGVAKVLHVKKLFSPAFFVAEDADMPEVLRAMTRSPSHRVLVKNGAGDLAGIIAPKDLLRLVHQRGSLGMAILGEVQLLQEEIENVEAQLKELSNYLSVFDQIFQSGQFGLHSADREGKILFANERLHQILGYKPGSLIGKSIFDLYPVEVHAEARAGLKRVMEEGKHHLIFSLMVTRSGATVQVDLASAALRDRLGEFVGTFTISRSYGSPAMLFDVPEVFPKSQDTE